MSGRATSGRKPAGFTHAQLRERRKAKRLEELRAKLDAGKLANWAPAQLGAVHRRVLYGAKAVPSGGAR